MIPARILPAVGIRSAPCPRTVGSGALLLLTAMTALVMFVCLLVVAMGLQVHLPLEMSDIKSDFSWAVASCLIPPPVETAAGLRANSLPISLKRDAYPR